MRFILKKIFPLLFISFIACKSADDYLADANLEAESGHFRLAIEKYEKAISKNPRLKSAYIQEGYCYEDMKLFDSAIKKYQSLIIVDPKNTEGLFRIGMCKDDQLKYAEAVEWYDNALRSKGFNPSDSASLQVIVDANKEGFLGNTDQVKYDVNSNDIFFNRGLAFYSSGQFKKAYSDFQSCIKSGYYMGSSYYMVGLCWLHAGKIDRACEAFSKGSLFGDSLSRMQLSKNLCN